MKDFIIKINNQKIGAISINTEDYNLENTDDHLSTFFSNDSKVPDVWRYTLSENETEFTKSPNEGVPEDNFKFKDISTEELNENDKTVILLLESPHKDEYSYSENSVEPLSPANGTTGDRIKKSLIQVICCASCLMDIPNLDRVKLIICNPIQWQTSMYFFYKIGDKKSLKSNLRNEVWEKIWQITKDNKFPIQEDFLKRIKSYKPVLVINACTGGSKEGSLNTIIRKYLDKNFSKVDNFSCFHPSHPSWNNNPYGINVEVE